MPTVYEVITAKIIDKLEAGTVPWHRPWSVETGAPRNLSSGAQIPASGLSERGPFFDALVSGRPGSVGSQSVTTGLGRCRNRYFTAEAMRAHSSIWTLATSL